MNMRKLTSGLRPLGLGLVCAIIGFSYALATAGARGTDGAELGNRAITTNATRPDTLFVTEADLGFIVVGSLFTRQVNVVFGFKPHLFQFTGTPPDGITISDSGTIQGKAKAPASIGFDVRVFDREVSPFSKQTTKSFLLTAVPAVTFPAPLDIVNTSPLPSAVTNAPYSYTFHANGGILPYQYFLGDDPDTLPKGLTFGTDGLLFGKPIIATNGATFKIGVIDGGGTVVVKSYTLRIVTGTVTSEFVGMRGTLNLEFGKDGQRDSGTLSLYVNKTDLYKAGIRKTPDLENVFFVMNIGGAQVPPSKFLLYGPDGTLASGATDGTTSSDDLYIFDKRGAVSFPNLNRGVLRKQGETTSYAIKLNPQTGLLTVKFKDLEFIKQIGANFLSFNTDPILPVNIQLGKPAQGRVKIINKDDETPTDTTDPTDPNATPDPVTTESDPVGTKNKTINIDRTDNIRFAFRRSVSKNKGNASENTKRPPGGLFLTTKVAGDIRKEEIFKKKDSLFMQFSGLLSDVDGAPIPITADDKIQVFASEVNLAEFPASMLVTVGSIISFRNSDPAIGLKTLILDRAKGTFFLETNAMDPRKIFGVDFVESGEPLTLPLTITIFNPLKAEPKFDGQTNVTVFRRGNKLRNK